MATPKLHVKKGDTVTVIAGKDKGKKGKVLSVDPAKGRVVVEGVNIVHRHSKPTKQLPQGGIVENESAVHASNLQLVCPRCNNAARTGRKVLDDGKKARYCMSCGEVVDKQ